jgi:hypothetical protein
MKGRLALYFVGGAKSNQAGNSRKNSLKARKKISRRGRRILREIYLFFFSVRSVSSAAKNI